MLLVNDATNLILVLSILSSAGQQRKYMHVYITVKLGSKDPKEIEVYRTFFANQKTTCIQKRFNASKLAGASPKKIFDLGGVRKAKQERMSKKKSILKPEMEILGLLVLMISACCLLVGSRPGQQI
eukprot:1161110-Pelagomonas_calceolata.AAC.17